MDCPNSEQNVPNDSICANNLTESANEQNQSQNASTSHNMFTMSDDTEVNKSFTFETLKNTIKHLKTTNANDWPEILIKIWFMVIEILRQNSNESAKAIKLTVKSTLDAMLMSEWHQMNKEPLKNKIDQCIPLIQNHPNMLYRCNYIIKNMNDPWSNSTFKKIISHNGNADEIAGTDQQYEEIEFFAIERGCMIEMRAQKLIEIGDCDDIAIKFLSHAIQAIYACTNDHLLRQTVSCRQLQSLLECYLSLLSKTRQMDKLKKELESMSLETIKEFIVNSSLSIAHYDRINQMKSSSSVDEKNKSGKKRKKNKKVKRTWIEILLEHHISVSKFAVQFVLVRILNDEYKRDGNIDTILEKLLRIWIEQNRSETDFEELFTKLVKNTTDNRKIYECCETFHRLFPNDCGVALQVFCRTLTLEINELEEKKFDLSAEAFTLLDFEKQISDRYLFLHNILYSYTEKRECVLTAFSMNPTQSNFELVCNYREETGSIDQTVMPILTDSLKSDLGCLLSQPRIKKLCWSSPWPELEKECQKLMQTENKIKILENSTATANDNLKYLDLNYDDFVDFKPHKYPGIEDGYDIYIIDSDSDSKFNAFEIDSDATDTAPESKNYILEEKREAQRMRKRKRNLIRRSQQQLADPGCSDRHRKRKYTLNESIDGLKNKRFPRKNMHKKTIKPDTDADHQTVDLSKETIIFLPEKEQITTDNNFSETGLSTEIKIEPKDDEIESNENETTFDEAFPEIKVELEDIDIKSESDIKSEIDSEYDQASIQTIIFGNENNEAMETNPTENRTINEENNATEYSNTSLSTEIVQDSQVHLDPDSDSITVNSNHHEMPDDQRPNSDLNSDSITINTNNYEMPDEQTPKRKNPLLSFRRPKKQPKLEPIQYDTETLSHSLDLIPSSTLSDFIPHYSDCSINKSEIPCEMEIDNLCNHRTEYCFQETTNVLPNIDNSEEPTKADIVILTKHCTVRLQRIPDQMFEDFQHHSSDSNENVENLKTENDAEYCENDIIDENTETFGIQDSLTKSNEADDAKDNSNIMYDGSKYQSNDAFNDSSQNSLSNQSSTVLNGYENECNGQEKLQEIHEAMTKDDEQSKQCEEIDQFQSVSMSDTQQQCMKHVQFHCMSIRINYSNHLSNMYPSSTYLKQCQTFTKKAYGLGALHQKKNEKNRFTRSTSLIHLCINNYCEWFSLKLPLPVTHIIIINAKNPQGKILFWQRSNDYYIKEHRLLNESQRFISDIQILDLRQNNIKICITILFGIAVRIWYSKFSFVKPPAQNKRQLFSDIFVFVFILEFICKICLVCGIILIVNLMMKTFKKSISNYMFDATPKFNRIKDRLKCWNEEYVTLNSDPKFQYTNVNVRKMDYGLSFAHRWKSSKFQWPIKSIIVVRMVQVLFTNDKHVQIRADNDNPDQTNSRATSQQTGVSIIRTTTNNYVAKADPIIEMTDNASIANKLVEQNQNNKTLMSSHQIIQNKPISKSSASHSNHLFYMLNSPPKPIASKYPRKIDSKIINNETASHARILLKSNGTNSSVMFLNNEIGNSMNGTVIKRIIDDKSSSIASIASAAIARTVSKPLVKSESTSANGHIKFQSIGLNAIRSSMNQSTYTINQINRNGNKLRAELNSNQHILLNEDSSRILQSESLPKFGFRIQMKNQSNDRGASIPSTYTISRAQLDKTNLSPKIIREKQNIHLKNNAKGYSENSAVTLSQSDKKTMIIIEEKPKDVNSKARAPSTVTQKGQSSIKPFRNGANVKLPMITLTSKEVSLPKNRQTLTVNNIHDKSQVQLNNLDRANIHNSASASINIPERLKTNSFILAQNGKPQQKDLAKQLHEFDMVMEHIKEQSSISLANNDNLSIILTKQENPSNLSKIDAKSFHTNTTALTRALNLAILKKDLSAEEAAETSESQNTFSDKTEQEPNELDDILSNSNGESQRDRQSRLFSPKQIQKLQEDEKTTKRIYDILAKYAEQISSSPDLRNKPAPRRRSNFIHVQSFAATTATTTATVSPNTEVIPKVTIPTAGHNEFKEINVLTLSNTEDCCDDTVPLAQIPKKRKKSLPNCTTNKIAKCNANDVGFTTIEQTSHNPTVDTFFNENPKDMHKSPLKLSTTTVKLPFSQQDCLIVKESLPKNQKTSLTKIAGRPLVIENSPPCTTSILLSKNYFLPMGIVSYASQPGDLAKSQCRQTLFQLKKKDPDKTIVNDAKNYDRSTTFPPETYIKKEMSDSSRGLSANEGAKMGTSNGPTKAKTLKLVSIKSPTTMSTILMNTLVQSNINSTNSKTQSHRNAHFQSGIMRPNGGILLFDNSYAALIAGNKAVLDTKQTNDDSWTTLKSVSDSVFTEGQKPTVKSSDHSKINVLHILDPDKSTNISSVSNSPSASNNEYSNQSLDGKDSTNNIKNMFRDDVPLNFATDDCDILNDIELSIMDSRQHNLIDDNNWLKIKSIYEDYQAHYDDQPEIKLISESRSEKILVDADNLSASFETDTKDPENAKMKPSLIDVQKSDQFTLNSMLTNPNQISSSKLIFRQESIFQKSLSEECGDLGVDEPCTSELFPEAFII